MHDAWLLGSAADPTADLTAVRDFDVIVSPGNWIQAAQLIPKTATPNTYGGWKCISEGKQVDVWPEDLGKRLYNILNSYAWHPNTGARFQRIR
jgi:hypothetical protein